MSWQMVHVTHASPEKEKEGVLRFWSEDYLWATRSRLEAPWGDETYGFVGAFAGDRRVGTMGERHAFKLTLNGSGEDECLFRPGQRAQVRGMEAGDQADLSALFNAPHPCVVKHYALGCFLGSHFEGEFVTLRRQANLPGFRALVLDGEETIMGFGTVIPSWRRHEGHRGILDLLVHPRYADRTGEVLEALEGGCGLERLSVYAEGSEKEKRGMLERAGYREVARLEGQLKVGAEYYHLVLYEKRFAGQRRSS